MTPVSFHDIEKAVSIIRGYSPATGFLKALGITAARYDSSLDAWLLTDADARKVQLLNGPYAMTILKMMEIRNGSDQS